MKLKSAKKAMEFIEDGMIIGLGGGSTVALLINELEKSEKKISAVTPSKDTLALCIEHNIPVRPLEYTTKIDVAFDGCDEVDSYLNALKSCGGIHTKEKIVASMAKDYILLADESKYFDTLAFNYPVTIEVIPAAKSYVEAKVKELGAVSTKYRVSDQKAGLVITDDGNYLLEAVFEHVENARMLSEQLKAVTGIVEHSLFCGVVTKAVIAKEDGIVVL